MELTLVALAVLVVFIWLYRRGIRKTVEPEPKPQSKPPKKALLESTSDCTVCEGNGWVYKKGYADFAKHAGYHGKEPCPNCTQESIA